MSSVRHASTARKGTSALGVMLIVLCVMVTLNLVLHPTIVPKRSPSVGVDGIAQGAARPTSAVVPQLPATGLDTASKPTKLGCGVGVQRACLGPEEAAEMGKYPSVYYTGCKEGDTTIREYSRRMLDENYRTALPHIAFRYEPISNTGHGIFGAVVIAIDHSTCDKVAVKLSKQGKEDSKHSQAHELAVMQYLQGLPGFGEQQVWDVAWLGCCGAERTCTRDNQASPHTAFRAFMSCRAPHKVLPTEF